MKRLMISGLLLTSIGILASTLSASAKELARVNETVLTEKDLNLSLGSLNEGQRGAVLRDPVSRRQILNDLIDREVLANEGEKLKLDQDPEFKEQMAALRKQLLMGRLLEKKLASQVTESGAKKYYEVHKDQFSTDRVRVQHILVADESEAKKILQMAQDSKNDFQELAEKYSKDPDAKNTRGELGFIGRDRLDPAFVELAFNTSEGQVAGPVHTAFGFHIIKVIEKKFGKPLEFHEVELQVRAALRQSLVRNYVDNLRKQNKIKIDYAAVDKM